MIISFIKFQYWRLYRYLLGLYSLFLVNLHVKLTPTRENSFLDMVLEYLRYKQRMVEHHRYNIWVKMCIIGGKLGVDEAKIRAESHLANLETEGELAKRVNK